jgi:hypothetical protein
MCCFCAKHAALRTNSKDWFAPRAHVNSNTSLQMNHGEVEIVLESCN